MASDSELSVLERVEHGGARAAVRMAARIAPLLPRRFRREADGVQLHPELQLLLAMREAIGSKPLSSFSVAEARDQIAREARVHAGERVPVGAVRDFAIDGPGGALALRHYAPLAAEARAPLLVFFHGGGFVVGDLDSHDMPCRVLCKRGGVHVLSVAYRLAPEQPFPAAVDDAWTAYRWASEHAEALGADPRRVAVGGDSAGGNLAAVICLLAAKSEQTPPPVLQLLIYPSVDRVTERRSLGLFADGLFLTRSEVAWYTDHYLGAHMNRADLRVSPLHAPSHAGLAPAIVVTAGFDPLRDEGEAYAAVLKAANPRCTLHREQQLVHGFINMGPLSPACADALHHIADMMRDALRGDTAPR